MAVVSAAAAALVVLVVGALLLTTGSVSDDTSPGPREASQVPSRPGEARLAGSQPDPYGGLAWGVGLYTDREERLCAVIGRRKGEQLGEVREGAFRPLSPQTPGACADQHPDTLVSNVLPRGTESRPRTIVYGRAAPDVSSVSASTPEGRRLTDTVSGGAFLFVFDRRLRSQDIDLHPILRPESD
jgi:hypothetical protein